MKKGYNLDMHMHMQQLQIEKVMRLYSIMNSLENIFKYFKIDSHLNSLLTNYGKNSSKNKITKYFVYFKKDHYAHYITNNKIMY